MSRSGYRDDLDQPELAMWRGRVASAIRGKRGQRLLRDLVAALDAMPEKALIAGDLVDEEGDVCALGCVGKARGLPVHEWDSREHGLLGEAFDVSPCLIQEIENENDGWCSQTPEERWKSVRRWAESQLKAVPQ